MTCAGVVHRILHRSRRPALPLVFALALACVAGIAGAQEWPARPIKLIAPFPPGGGADTIGRVLAQFLGEQFRQSIVVENRPGAGGLIGAEAASKAAPDGHTLVVSSLASHVVAPAMSRNPPYDPMAAFTHIAVVGGPPTLLLVEPDLPARTIAEFVALTKTMRDGMSYGSPGPGSHGHLIGEVFRAQTGANLVHVSYKGASFALNDLMGKQIRAAFITLSTANQQVRSGRLRALGVTSAQRIADLPDVPTFAERGMPQLTALTWFGISAPAGLSPAIAARLNDEVRRALKTPKVREKLEFEGIETLDLDLAGVQRFYRSEIERWTPLARATQPAAQ